MGVSRDVLLCARDWQSRALTLAELKEAGYEVTAVPGVRFALELLERHRIEPPLVIVDVYADPDATPEAVAQMLHQGGGAPLILVTGLVGAERWEPLRPRCAALLRRPVSIGEITSAARRVLPPGPPNPDLTL